MNNIPLVSPSRRWLVWLGILSSFVGMALAAVTLYDHAGWQVMGDDYASMCQVTDKFADGAFDCRKVAASPYAQIFGVPLGVPSIVFYALAVVLAGAYLILAVPVILNALHVFGFASLLASLALAYISHTLVGALCSVCLAIYLVNLVFFCCWWRAGSQFGFFSRLVSGSKAILSMPVTFFRVTGVQMVVASLGALILAMVSLGATFLPRKMEEQILHTKIGLTPPEASLTDLFTKWATLPPDRLTVVNDGSRASDFSKGPGDAPVRIVEFSDLECPACKHAYLLLEDVFQRYPGKVHLTYKNFPLDRSCNPLLTFDLHHNACVAAAYARCVGEKGKFWDALQQIFGLSEIEQQLAPEVVRKAILSGAKSFGITSQEIDECVADTEVIAKIHKDIVEGEQLRVEGTPTIWINEKRLPSLKLEFVNRVVESLIAEAGGKASAGDGGK